MGRVLILRILSACSISSRLDAAGGVVRGVVNVADFDWLGSVLWSPRAGGARGLDFSRPRGGITFMKRFFVFVVLIWFGVLRPACAQDYDVVVYGATPAGISAALSAARERLNVLLVEPTDRVGGMLTHGLSHTDFRTFESLSGWFLEFTRRVDAHYRAAYGENSPQHVACFRGTNAEPKVNLAVLEQMLSEHPTLQKRTNWELEGARTTAGGVGSTDAPAMRSIGILLFRESAGEFHSVKARYFVDASYEGDLLAAVEVPYRVGREARAEYGESLAPEQADAQLQAYNYRFILTREPENRVLPRRPAGYDRARFAGLVPLLEEGRIKKVFGMKPDAVFKAHVPGLPNGKFDINDMSLGPVRLSLPGAILTWPDGKGGEAIRRGPQRHFLVPPFSRLGLSHGREPVLDEHKLWNVGLLYFLQNDEAVPAAFREEARDWGFARDEFRESHYFPAQIYVREARRMCGRYVFSQRDVEADGGTDSIRSKLHRDAIAMGDYGPNCHGTGHEGSPFGGTHTGEFYLPVAPYQIPYGVLLPINLDNLLVTCALSSSHVGFCSLRYEPIWSALGEAAGQALVFARRARVGVHQVSVSEIQRALHKGGSSTVYFSDMLPGHPDFAVFQWWGTLGGFHVLPQRGFVFGQRGDRIAGQYFKAFAGHAVEPGKMLEESEEREWRALARKLGIAEGILPALQPGCTRGEWIRALWERVARDDSSIPR